MWTGIALFFSTYYILGLNPYLLSNAGVPAGAALTGTFIAVIGGNLTGARWTGTGLMIAPAVGIGAFFSEYLQAMHDPQSSLKAAGLTWQNLFFGCFVAGIGVCLTSFWTDWRARIVDELPEAVKRAATGSIGALLLKASLTSYSRAIELGIDRKHGMLAVLIGVGILLGAYLVRNRVATMPPWLRVLARCEFLLVAIAMSLYIYLAEPQYYDKLPHGTELDFIWRAASVSDFINFAGPIPFIPFILTAMFAAILWFIVMTDVPGTPGVVLPEDFPERADAIRGGFKNDGVWALASPLVGTTPTIYYAENHLLRTFGQFTAGVGYWVAGLFALTFAATLIIPHLDPSFAIERILPPFATVPILMFIGVLVIGASYGQRSDERPPEYYIPAAIGVVLTPAIGLEKAFPLAVLSWWLIPTGDDTKRPSFVAISIGAAIVLLLYGALILLSP
jgi:AGZA family xanthine/uracil permease-like MFS transporter